MCDLSISPPMHNDNVRPPIHNIGSVKLMYITNPRTVAAARLRVFLALGIRAVCAGFGDLRVAGASVGVPVEVGEENEE